MPLETLPSHRQETVIEIKNLSVKFMGQDVNTIDDVSLTVQQGRALCIVGESGCGKSVTSLAVMGLLPQRAAQITAGQVLFQGQDLLSLDRSQLEELRGNRMAMIFQEPMTSLNPVFPVGDQVTEAVMRHRKCSKQEARDRALEMFRRVRIPAPEKRLDEYPYQLSGGMRQRVMIAMALANDPLLLIADEPTTALDVTIQAQILDLMRDLQEETGTALVIITHDLGVVAEIADDVAVMYAGQVVECGPVETIFTNPQHPYTIGLMGSMPSLSGETGRLMTIRGSVPPPHLMPKGCRFSTRCPFADRTCWNEVPSLAKLPDGNTVACFKAPLETHIAEVA